VRAWVHPESLHATVTTGRRAIQVRARGVHGEVDLRAVFPRAVLSATTGARTVRGIGLPSILAGERAHNGGGTWWIWVLVAVVAAGAAADAQAVERRRKETGAFLSLEGTTADELVQIIADVDPHTAIAIVDLFGLDDGAAKLLAAKVPPQRRTEIGLGLASPRILAREHLAQMESIATQALARVRNRVPLGGPQRLAELLARAPAAIRGELLEAIAARDPDVAREARAELILFDDLPGLDDASVKRIITGVDPATVALALAGADAARDVVLAAVSKRLRAILEVEVDLAKDRPAAEVEEARRVLERAMRVLHARGDLHLRGSAETSAAAA